MTFSLFILYFYGWFRTVMHLLSLWLYPPRVEVYAWSDKLGHMTRLWRYKKKEEEEEDEEYNRYYVLFKESIMVFDDKEKTLQLLEKGEKEMPSRGPFRHFMEAEVVMIKKKGEQAEDVTHLLNQYDDGHGTFYHRHSNYTLTPADLYDFSQKKFILHADDTQTLTVTPMDTLEPRAVSQFESIF